MRRTAGALLAAICCGAVGSADSTEARDDRPTVEPTRVEIAVTLLDLERIDDASQGFSASVFIAARWNDPRLAHDGPGLERRDLDDVWHPRLQLVNRRQISETLPETVDVEPDGSVVFRQRYVGQFSQRLDLADFPIDRQTLAVHLVAVGYSEDEIVFEAADGFPSGVAPELSISDWRVTGSRAGLRGFQPVSVVRPTAGFVLEVDAERNIGYYVWKISIPLLLIVGMSWVVFWIDPELSAPQISVAVTSMLTLIAYRFMVGGMLPRISYLTRMDRFTTASTILVFLTLVEAVATVMLHKRGRAERARAVDRISRWAFPLAYGVVFVWSFVL